MERCGGESLLLLHEIGEEQLVCQHLETRARNGCVENTGGYFQRRKKPWWVKSWKRNMEGEKPAPEEGNLKVSRNNKTRGEEKGEWWEGKRNKKSRQRERRKSQEHVPRGCWIKRKGKTCRSKEESLLRTISACSCELHWSEIEDNSRKRCQQAFHEHISECFAKKIRQRWGPSGTDRGVACPNHPAEQKQNLNRLSDLH